MKGQETLMSHKSDEWCTPMEFFARLDDEFHFALDAAASMSNRKCEIFYSHDSLNCSWSGFGNVFVNPPYSQVKGFVKKAYEESLNGCDVVCLVPARTDTKWWHEYAMRADEIRFVKGRIKFVDPSTEARNSAPTLVRNEFLGCSSINAGIKCP